MSIDWFEDYTKVYLGGSFIAKIRVGKCPPNKKWPDGITTRLVLIDKRREKPVPRLLIDNHEPIGYHIHTELPENHDYREPIDVKTHKEAIQFFLQEVSKIIAEVTEEE